MISGCLLQQAIFYLNVDGMSHMASFRYPKKQDTICKREDTLLLFVKWNVILRVRNLKCLSLYLADFYIKINRTSGNYQCMFVLDFPSVIIRARVFQKWTAVGEITFRASQYSSFYRWRNHRHMERLFSLNCKDDLLPVFRSVSHQQLFLSIVSSPGWSQ